jgi:hypothetical protein
MRKRDAINLIQKDVVKTTKGKTVNVEIKQTGFISDAMERLPEYREAYKSMPAGPEKQKIKELIRMYEKVLKENEKIRKAWKVVEERKKEYRQSSLLLDIIRPDTSRRAAQMEIDFERPYHNDSLMTTDAFIQHGNFNFMQKKLIECVSSLLCKRSENMHDYKADNFITGDGYDAKRNMTFLMINEYDIAKEYAGGEKVGGALLLRIKKALFDVAQTPANIVIGNKGYVGPLWTYEYTIDDNGPKMAHGGGIYIHAIFRTGLKYLYVKKPDNFIKLLNDAAAEVYGTRAQSKEVDHDLYNVLCRQAVINPHYEKNEKDLLETFAKNEIDKKRIGEARSKIEGAIKVCERMGLITEWNRTDNKSGGQKYVFKLARYKADKSLPEVVHKK